MLVGFETADDAGVVRLSDETALVQTLDFFTPVADDPETYGHIAAVNALNDVYAMGGTPISALSIVCYPQKGDWDILEAILRGGQNAMNAENVSVIGGHSVDDPEMKFGYAVTGIVDPQRIIRNAGARVGDVLVLTKAIGTGAINTAIKNGKASRQTETAALDTMKKSAREASMMMRDLDTSACTDVTGFGLLGHAYEMANASDVTLNIAGKDVPLLPDVLDLISEGMLTRGDKNNRDYVGDNIRMSDSVAKEMQSALFDPQTAGGLLIAISAGDAQKFVGKLDASIIGSVSERSEFLIEVK